jgi:LCP family protein required for cell wall assembly
MIRARRVVTAAAVAVAIALVATAAGVTLAAGAAVAWLRRPGPATVQIHAMDEAAFRWQPGQPLFVLALGSDERAGLDGARADAIHLIGVNPGTGQATILNIPRDTYVDIPGVGRKRINEAYNHGGPVLQAETVAQFTGARPAFVLVTTFPGLQSMVDEMGGVIVDVAETHRDSFSGAFFDPGPNYMNGGQALAYARNRHISGGDHTRTANQANLIIAALRKLRIDGTSPTNAVRYLTVLLRHTKATGVSTTDLFRLGRVALDIDPAAVRNVTMPGRSVFVGAASVVVPVAPAAALFADFADDAVLQSH